MALIVTWDPPDALSNPAIFYNIPPEVQRTAKLKVQSRFPKATPRVRVREPLQPWLTVSPMSFTSPAELTVTIDTSNLKVGTELFFELEFILDE